MATTTTSYSIAEAAIELGVTERRVRQLVSEGRLKIETDGMGRQRLSKAQVDRELKRRGRVSVKSLPTGLGAAAGVDPLIARQDEMLEVAKEIVDLLRDIKALCMSNTRTLGDVFEKIEGLAAS